jgi:transcription initiation factor IIE alpha subunit
MRHRRRAKALLQDHDPQFYTCPSCHCPDLKFPERGTHDLEGRTLFQCARCGRIASDSRLKDASRRRLFPN